MSCGLRILALVPDAFGGRGGIAQYNRHLLHALCADPAVDSVVALPRLLPDPAGPLPPKLQFVTAAAGGWARYAGALASRLLRRGGFDVVVCGHLNLLPLAALAALRYRARLLLVVYGVEAWERPPRRIGGWLLGCVDRVCSISAVTLDRMRAWYPRKLAPASIVPNAFDPAHFTPGPKPAALVDRYALHQRRVLLIFGRMSPTERLKGFDEVLEATPALLARLPDLAVVLAGDGGDRARLEQKARALGISQRVVFTGFVAEAEKADLYRLADAFILPSRQEGFGFVLIEAMACGTPSIGSIADGSREAVLDGEIGLLVDPASSEDIVRAVCEAMTRPRGVPGRLGHFSLAQFESRVSQMLADIAGGAARQGCFCGDAPAGAAAKQ
jgi:phosphatidylinositol alpha-1,6-mannosyltransferase